MEQWRTPWSCEILEPFVIATTSGEQDIKNWDVQQVMRSMKSEMQSLRKEMTVNATISNDLVETIAELRGLRNGSFAEDLAEMRQELRSLQRAPAEDNKTSEEVQTALRGLKVELLPLLQEKAIATSAAAAAAQRAAAQALSATTSRSTAQGGAPLRGMTSHTQLIRSSNTSSTVNSSAAAAHIREASKLRSLMGSPGHRSTVSWWSHPAAVACIACLVGFGCVVCLVAGGSRRSSGSMSELQRVALSEVEPLVQRNGSQNPHWEKLDAGSQFAIEDTMDTHQRSLASALETQVATLNSELSTLRARSHHLETKYKEVEEQRGGHLEERRRLLGELEATAAKAEAAERARASLDERLRLEQQRLEAAAGAKKKGKCGCSVQ